MRYSPLMLLIAIGCTPPGKPMPPKVDAAKDFNSLYAVNCAGCHGADGKLGPAPPLNFESRVYDETANNKIIREGRKGTAMTPFAKSNGGPLTDEQCKLLSEGIRTKWLPESRIIGAPIESRKTAKSADGKVVFAKSCASCHGANGEGGTFEGQPVGAIHNASYLSLCSDEYLKLMIERGRPDLRNPSGHDWSKNRPWVLAGNDINDVIAYIRTWQGSP